MTISNVPASMYNPETLTKYYFRCIGVTTYTTVKDTYSMARVDKWGGLRSYTTGYPFLPMLIRCTDLALLSLGNVEHGVGEQEALQNRCRVLRQMPDLVHQEVAGAGQVEVVGAGLSVQVPRQRR